MGENKQSNNSRFIWTIFVLAAIIFTATLIYFINESNEKVDFWEKKDITKNIMQVDDAILKTNFGDIEITFLPEKAPKTVENFINLAESNFFDGTQFHRIIADFMIQGGDPLTKNSANKDRFGTGGPDYTFEDEINDEKLTRGAVAMANHGPDTNGSQFFIVVKDETPWLDGKHTVFARVTRGMEIVQKISELKTGVNDLPFETVHLEDVFIR
jgi:peptidyl-prolyl cis-trans isomerase B (cyclophilin B)